ncbi:YuiA family protein [Brevibacillus sp. TJ4]|uniref:YuiA family protein n=1 Tax=Brevibacillus sp. TJ4 TaxID=3234853 RepID=UPI003B9E11C1
MKNTKEACTYCQGEGYFQLLLGGTESCPGCAGTGVQPSHEATAAIGSAAE